LARGSIAQALKPRCLIAAQYLRDIFSMDSRKQLILSLTSAQARCICRIS